MNKIYESLKIEVQGGQYRREDMVTKLDYACFEANPSKITELEHSELTLLIEEHIDKNYKPVKTQAQIDAKQDVQIISHDSGVVELFEMVMLLLEPKTIDDKSTTKMFPQTRSIAMSYVNLILTGKRTFESVHVTKKREVADILIDMGREDLITDESYLPKTSVDQTPQEEPIVTPVE